MSDLFYQLVRSLGRPAFWISSSPVVLHADRLHRPGGLILAPNHLSPYDVPCLMASTRRPLDFVSITEIFRTPLARWFFYNMNAFPLDRRRVNPGATRKILDRLAQGRLVAMFPEGRIRSASDSILVGGSLNDSVVRLAQLAGVPVVPCAILGTGAYGRPAAWLPLKRTRYAACFGQPLSVERSGDEQAACAKAAQQLLQAYRDLYAELREASGLSVGDTPWRRPEAPVATDHV